MEIHERRGDDDSDSSSYNNDNITVSKRSRYSEHGFDAIHGCFQIRFGGFL